MTAALPVLVMASLVMAGLALVRRGAFLRVHWRPDRDVLAAVAVAGLAVAFSAAILWVPQDGLAERTLLFVGIWGVCGSVLPWAWVTRVEGRGAEAMGLRREGLVPALLLSLLAGAALFAPVWWGGHLDGLDPAYFARASVSLLAGGLFELFLYFGFVHLRLERAFGPLPAIVGSAGLYTFWHVGTELPMHEDPFAALGMLFCVGLLYHAFFQITHHLASIWPLFFFGGVWVDFAQQLDFPPEIAEATGWAALSWVMLLGAPLLLLRTRRPGAAASGR